MIVLEDEAIGLAFLHILDVAKVVDPGLEHLETWY